MVEELVRVELLVEGRVQGVGYRYAVCRIAESTKVTGWVRNLQDGRVQVLCEGQPKAVDEFLERIRISRGGSIDVRGMAVASRKEVKGRLYSGFTVARG